MFHDRPLCKGAVSLPAMLTLSDRGHNEPKVRDLEMNREIHRGRDALGPGSFAGRNEKAKTRIAVSLSNRLGQPPTGLLHQIHRAHRPQRRWHSSKSPGRSPHGCARSAARYARRAAHSTAPAWPVSPWPEFQCPPPPRACRRPPVDAASSVNWAGRSACPAAPAASRKAPMLAAWPMHRVLTSQRTNCMVS